MANETRYVWLDAEGNRASPRHTSMRSALNFRKLKIANQLEDDPRYPARDETNYSSKPPLVLKKLILVEELQDLDAEEEQAIELILKYGG